MNTDIWGGGGGSSEKAHHFKGEELFQNCIKDYESKHIYFLWIDLHELIFHHKNSNVR